MRVLLIAVSMLGIAGAANRAAALDYPWCVHYSVGGDAGNCGFVSFEQCRMTASGTAGYCQRNPF